MSEIVVEPTKKMSLVDLRKFEGPLYVENLTPHKITCYEELGRDILKFELSPAGSPGYIDELPKAALSVKGFRNLIFRGDVRVSTDENMQESIEVQAQNKAEQDKIRQSGLLAQVEESKTSKDLVEKACLSCGSKLFQSVKLGKEGNPPLCSKHLSEVNKFVPTLNDKQEWIFTPLTAVTVTK